MSAEDLSFSRKPRMQGVPPTLAHNLYFAEEAVAKGSLDL